MGTECEPPAMLAASYFPNQHRPHHCIRVVAAGGRIEFAYTYGDRPE